MFMKQADKENEKWRGPRRQTIDLMCQVKAGFARDYHHLLEQYARKQRRATAPTVGASANNGNALEKVQAAASVGGGNGPRPAAGEQTGAEAFED